MVRKQVEIIGRTLTTLSLLTNLSLLLFFFLFAEGLSTVKRPLVALVFCGLLFLFFALLFCSGRKITKNGRSERNRRGTRRLSRSEEHTSELPVTNAHLVCRVLIEQKNIKQTR